MGMTMSVARTITGPEGYFLQTSADGARVYGVGEGRTLYVIEIDADPIVVTTIEFTFGYSSMRGVTTTPDSRTILIASSSGLIKMDAATLTVTGFLEGRYQSVVVRPPLGLDNRD